MSLKKIQTPDIQESDRYKIQWHQPKCKCTKYVQLITYVNRLRSMPISIHPIGTLRWRLHIIMQYHIVSWAKTKLDCVFFYQLHIPTTKNKTTKETNLNVLSVRHTVYASNNIGLRIEAIMCCNFTIEKVSSNLRQRNRSWKW